MLLRFSRPLLGAASRAGSLQASRPLLSGMLQPSRPLLGSVLQTSRPLQAKAVYYKIWGSTANYHQRYSWGWFQVWSRLAWWAIPIVPAACWYLFPWFNDDWKKIITLGLFEPPLIHWDTNMTDYRSKFVKGEDSFLGKHAEFPGTPYR